MSRVEEAISEALVSGYQVLPDAFELLQNLGSEFDAVALVRDVVRLKWGSDANKFVITRQDIQNLLPKSSAEEQTEHEVVECDVNIQTNYAEGPSVVEDLDGYRLLMSSRFTKLLKIVKQRQDASQIQKVSRIGANAGKSAKVAGLLLDKRLRRNGVEVTIDDDTGEMVAYTAESGVRKKVSDLILDQFVVADVGVSRQGEFVIRNIHPPDVPDKVPSFSKKSVYVVFTSDLHIGSRTFLSASFARFLEWVSGRSGDLDIVKRLVCIVIGGDTVDGVGLYLGHEYDVSEPRVRAQYNMLAEYMERIPKRIKVVLIPGDHDATRQALPQPPIPRKYAGHVYDLENVRILGDPAQFTVNGVNILAFHGRSIDDVTAMVPGLSVSRPAQAMKILLKARHLAPFYGGKAVVAPEQEDNLVIDQVPDIFHAGHVHYVDLENYRGTVILNSGTWQAQTVYQRNVGVLPSVGVVPIVNLATLELTTRSFVSP